MTSRDYVPHKHMDSNDDEDVIFEEQAQKVSGCLFIDSIIAQFDAWVNRRRRRRHHRFVESISEQSILQDTSVAAQPEPQ